MLLRYSICTLLLPSLLEGKRETFLSTTIVSKKSDNVKECISDINSDNYNYTIIVYL